MSKPPETPDEPQAVGYGKPPTGSQFKKGKSGNPKGRPKGSLNLRTLVIDQAKAKVVVKINGESKSKTGLEAFMLALQTRALQGKGASENNLLQLYQRFLPDEEPGGPAEISDEDRALLADHVKFLQALQPDDGE